MKYPEIPTVHWREEISIEHYAIPRHPYQRKYQGFLGDRNFGDTHRNRRDSSHNLSIIWKTHLSGLSLRLGMGDEKQSSFAKFALGTSTTITEFDEVNRTIELIGLFAAIDVLLARINLDE